MDFVIPVIITILLVYLLVKKQGDKKKENFEDRNN